MTIPEAYLLELTAHLKELTKGHIPFDSKIGKDWFSDNHRMSLIASIENADLPKFRLSENYRVVNALEYEVDGVKPRMFGVICSQSVISSSEWLSKVVRDIEEAAYEAIVYNRETRYEYKEMQYPQMTEDVSMPEVYLKEDDAPKNDIDYIIRWIGFEVFPLAASHEHPTYIVRVVLNAKYNYLAF